MCILCAKCLCRICFTPACYGCCLIDLLRTFRKKNAIKFEQVNKSFHITNLYTIKFNSILSHYGFMHIKIFSSHSLVFCATLIRRLKAQWIKEKNSNQMKLNSLDLVRNIIGVNFKLIVTTIKIELTLWRE